MANTKFFGPRTLAETLDILDTYREEALIVNGGTDIVAQIASGAVNPSVIVYIQNVQQLKEIRSGGGHVCLGGAVTYVQIQTSPDCQQFSAMQKAIAECGSPSIRVVGTPAGNIGTAAPAADCNVALIALGAEVVLANKGGERIVPMADMFVAAWKTQRQPNEIIKEIHIPVVKNASGSGFVKLAKRKAQDIAQVSAAVSLSVDNKVIEEICIALGAVAPTAVRAKSLEALAKGKTLEAAMEAVNGQIPDEAALRNPRNKAYKEAVMGVAVARSIKQAFEAVERGN